MILPAPVSMQQPAAGPSLKKKGVFQEENLSRKWKCWLKGSSSKAAKVRDPTERLAFPMRESRSRSGNRPDRRNRSSKLKSGSFHLLSGVGGGCWPIC